MTEKDIYRLETDLEKKVINIKMNANTFFLVLGKSRLIIKERYIKEREDLHVPFGTIHVFVPMTDSNIRVAQ